MFEADSLLIRALEFGAVWFLGGSAVGLAAWWLFIKKGARK